MDLKPKTPKGLRSKAKQIDKHRLDLRRYCPQKKYSHDFHDRNTPFYNMEHTTVVVEKFEVKVEYSRIFLNVFNPIRTAVRHDILRIRREQRTQVQ